MRGTHAYTHTLRTPKKKSTLSDAVLSWGSLQQQMRYLPLTLTARTRCSAALIPRIAVSTHPIRTNPLLRHAFRSEKKEAAYGKRYAFPRGETSVAKPPLQSGNRSQGARGLFLGAFVTLEMGSRSWRPSTGGGYVTVLRAGVRGERGEG